MTQKEMVWAYLLKNGSITPRQAAKPPIRTMRLADHIFKLRKEGKQIETTMREKKRGGQRFTYAEYSIVRKEERGHQVAD